MKSFENIIKPVKWLMASLLLASVVGCGSSSSTTAAAPAAGDATVLPGVAGTTGANATNPTVISAIPRNLATTVPTSTESWTAASGVVTTGTLVTATFSGEMDPTTINSSPAGTLSTFTLKTTSGSVNVAGTVAMNTANKVATFTPTAALAANTSYTATVTTAAKNAGSVTAMPKSVAWSFTTNATALTGQAPVNLLTAGDYVIRANTAITYNGTAGAAAITGDVGISPSTSAAITGFSVFAQDTLKDFATAAEVVSPGKIYAPDYIGGEIGSTGLTPAKMTAAQNDNITAYNDAAGRTAGTGTFLNAGAGSLNGLTLVPGVYTWGADLISSGDVTISGGPDDVFVFQVAGFFRPGNATNMILSNPLGGALPQAKNIFWVVAGSDATLGTTAHVEGVILTNGYITLNSGATVNGRLLSRTAVTVGGTVTQPAP